MKRHFKIENLKDLISIRQAASRKSVDNLFRYLSIIKIDKDVYFNDKELQNLKFVEVNYQPTVESHLTPKR